MSKNKLFIFISILIIITVFTCSVLCSSCENEEQKNIVFNEDSETPVESEEFEESYELAAGSEEEIEDKGTEDKKIYELVQKYGMHFGVGGGLYPDIENGEDMIHAITRDLDKLGMIWLRHPGNGISWWEVQPIKDTWDFRKLDAVIGNNEHPWIIPIYGMIGNPYPFNSDFSREYLESLGDKEDIMQYIIANEIDMSDLQQKADAEIYVKTLVNRYKDKIKYWEIGGNEGIVSSKRFDIVVNTYTWVREVDPEAIVLITAVGGDDNNQFYNGIEAFDKLLSKGIGDYFDIGHFHYYEHFGGNFEERLEKRFEEYKKVMDKYSVKKPIWVTETSTSSYEQTVLSEPGSEQLQARHVVIRLVVFSAKGAEKVFWFDYSELNPGDKFYGCNLTDSINGHKPAYYTFKLLVEKIGYYNSAETLRSDDVRLYKFIVDKDKQVFIAWSNDYMTIDLSQYINSEKVIITHIIEDNSTEPVIEVTKTTSIELSASPVFIEYK